MPFGHSKTRFAVASLGLAVLAGCQFGNKSTTELKGYDVISGYYAALPQTLSFEAQVGAGAPRAQNAPVTKMPEFLKAVMGNPTMLYYDDPIRGQASLRSHENTAIGFPTKVEDRLSTFGLSTEGYAEISGCRFVEETAHTGSFAQSATTTVVGGFTARGKIELDFTAVYSFVGEDVDCDVMRGVFKSCYSDGVGCSASPDSIFNRDYVRKVFAAPIAAGILTEAEIQSVRSVGFRASYQ